KEKRRQSYTITGASGFTSLLSRILSRIRRSVVRLLEIIQDLLLFQRRMPLSIDVLASDKTDCQSGNHARNQQEHRNKIAPTMHLDQMIAAVVQHIVGITHSAQASLIFLILLLVKALKTSQQITIPLLHGLPLFAPVGHGLLMRLFHLSQLLSIGPL